MGSTLNTRWRMICACEKGTSHEGEGTPCQDSVFCDELHFANDSILFMAVADGAGSAKFSSEASEAACMAVKRLAGGWAKGADLNCSPSIPELSEWVEKIHADLNNLAAARIQPAREFACTLLGAICHSKWSAYFQIGDGAIVTIFGGKLQPVFWPESGEYANMTYFVTDPEYKSHLSILADQPPVEEIALMTDGLQRLALNFSDKSAHSAFFKPLFSALRKQPDEESVFSLEGLLRKLLNSQQVNSRTDDDKTLALACVNRGS